MTKYSVERLDHLGVVAGTIKDLGLIELIDSHLGKFEGEKLSAGETVAGMILNGLGFSDKPISLTPLFFRNCPLSLLFREGVDAEDFNRFKIGRVMDRAHAFGTETLFYEAAKHCCEREGIDLTFNHLDTSTFSLTGEYLPDSDEQAILINHGHSKDHRPDLKQAALEMMVSQDGNIPILCKILDGNSSDNTVFRERANALAEEFRRSDMPRYLIADCKLYTEKNSGNLAGLPFITRIPQNIKKVQEIITRAVEHPDAWREFDNDRKVQVFGLEHYGIKQRWCVVSSETSRAGAVRRTEKKAEKEKKGVERQLARLRAVRFHCTEDAVKAAEDLSGKWTLRKLAGYKVVEHRHYKNKGRPGKNTRPDSVLYQIIAESEPDGEMLDRLRETSACYVTGTNISREELATQEIIDGYRSQDSVEQGFRFLKDPLFFTSSLFLKKPSRISALLMIMVLSLMVYGIAERRMRNCLAEQRETLPDQINRPVSAPTLRWIFQLLNGISRIRIAAGDHVSYILEGISELRKKILLLFGNTVATIYQVS